MPRILVVPVGSVPDVAPLHALTDVEVLAPDDPGLPDALARAEGLVVWDGMHPALERAWALAAPRRLRWVHTSSAGPDRLLFPALRDHPCVLTCSRGVLDTDIAEYVLASVLAVLKDLPVTVRRQAEHRWEHRTTRSLAGSRALVVGAGSIGTRVGQVFAALGVAVDGVVRTPRPATAPFGRLVGPGDLARVAGDYDHLLVTAPLSEATRGLVDARVVDALRRGRSSSTWVADPSSTRTPCCGPCGRAGSAGWSSTCGRANRCRRTARGGTNPAPSSPRTWPGRGGFHRTAGGAAARAGAPVRHPGGAAARGRQEHGYAIAPTVSA